MGMIAPIVLARYLSRADFGDYKQLLLLADTATGIILLGIPVSLFYYVPRSGSSSHGLVVRSLGALMVLGVVGATLFGFAGGTLEQVFNVPFSAHLPWLIAYVAISVPSNLTYSLPIADQRAQYQAFLLIALESGRALVLALTAITTRSITPLVIALVVYAATKLLAGFFYVFVQRSEPAGERGDPPGFIEQMRYSTTMWGAGLLTLVRDQSHFFFVSAMFTDEQYAAYAIGTLSIPIVGHVNDAIGNVMQVQVAGTYHTGHYDEVRRVWFRGLHNLALVLIPLFVVIEVYAHDLIVVAFGTQYADSVPILRAYFLILLVFVPLLSSPLLKATGDIHVHFLCDFASFVGTLATLLVAGRYFGLPGAAVSPALGYVAFALTATPVAARRLRLPATAVYDIGPKARIAFWSVVACLLPWGAMQGLPPALRLVAGGLLSGVLWAAAAWHFRLIEERERELIRGWLKRAAPGWLVP